MEEDKELETPGAPKSAMTSEEMIAMALTALAPALIGGAVGGKAGMYGGAAVGSKAAGGIAQNRVEEDKDAKKTSEADARAKKSMEEKIGLINYENDLKNKNQKPPEPKLMTNAKGQIVSIDSTGKSTVVDASTKPPPSAAGTTDGINPRFEKLVDSAGKEMSGHGKLFSAIKMVEDELKFKLDDVNDKGQVKQADGSFKDVDLPGANVWGLGRVTTHSADARMLEGSIASIFNTELKDRSGAAVTDNELNRLKMEFNAGRFNTEPEMLRALKRYKIRAAEVLANAEARYNPEVLAEYSGRGGFTSKSLGDGPVVAAPPPTKEQALAEKERRQKAAAAATSKSGGG